MIKKIRVPKTRLKILLKAKDKIEQLGNVKVEINGEVTISGDDSLKVYNVEKVVTAIARGFSPKDALNLFDEEYILYVIPIAKKKNTLIRMRSRLIGTHGTIKRRIEEITGTKISIYGKTVSIIGRGDGVEYARQAIEMILEGRKFATVFAFLGKVSREF